MAVEIASVADIARDLAVDRRTVYGWMARYPDYPQPISRVGNARVWDLAEVRTWHERMAPQLHAGRRRGS
jgi:predicted DNA-binding transcriptional regulator AlpA